MSEWLNAAFSGGVSLARVNGAGIALMAAAIAMIFAANPISKRCPEARRQLVYGQLKLVGLLLCCMGTAVAIL